MQCDRSARECGSDVDAGDGCCAAVETPAECLPCGRHGFAAYPVHLAQTDAGLVGKLPVADASDRAHGDNAEACRHVVDRHPRDAPRERREVSGLRSSFAQFGDDLATLRFGQYRVRVSAVREQAASEAHLSVVVGRFVRLRLRTLSCGPNERGQGPPANAIELTRRVAELAGYARAGHTLDVASLDHLAIDARQA